MAQALERASGDTDQILFELESLELTAVDRLEVSGRWYGVRGRRFVRPTLTLLGGGTEPRHRSLADLDHKPWSAEDGELTARLASAGRVMGLPLLDHVVVARGGHYSFAGAGMVR